MIWVIEWVVVSVGVFEVLLPVGSVLSQPQTAFLRSSTTLGNIQMRP